MSGRFAAFSIAANQKNAGGQKKRQKKSLIPLPPTGFVSFFCAKTEVMQTKLQPKRAVGLCRRSAVSQIAKF